MRSNYKINIFLENKKWLNKKIFNSKKIMEYYFKSLATMAIKECLLKPKFKKFRNVKININLILSDDNFLKKLNTNFLNKKKSIIVNEFFFNQPEEIVFRSLSKLIHNIGNKKSFARGKKILSLLNDINLNKYFKKKTLSGCILEKVNKSIVISKEI